MSGHVSAAVTSKINTGGLNLKYLEFVALDYSEDHFQYNEVIKK